METKIHSLKLVKKELNHALIEELRMMLELAETGEISEYASVYSVNDSVSVYVNNCDHRFAALAAVLMNRKCTELLNY